MEDKEAGTGGAAGPKFGLAVLGGVGYVTGLSSNSRAGPTRAASFRRPSASCLVRQESSRCNARVGAWHRSIGGWSRDLGQDGSPPEPERERILAPAECVTFRMAEVAVPRKLFAPILQRIQRFGMPPPLLQRG